MTDHGQAFCCKTLEEAVEVTNRWAPEHLEVVPRLQHYGGLFVGNQCAEVLGDYGAGPNHTLPTGGTARCTGGLSVFTFLRVRTWMRIDDKEASQGLVQDAIKLGRMEGLEAHA